MSSSRTLEQHPTESREVEICKEQIRLLFSNAPIGIIGSAVNALLLVYVLRHAVGTQELALWFGVHLVALSWRLKCLVEFRARGFAVHSHEVWRRRFLVSALFMGIAWAGAGLLPTDSIPHQVFIAFVLGGMAAGASVSSAPRKEAFFAYAIPVMTTLVIRFLLVGNEIAGVMGTMVAVFGVAIMLIATRNERTILRSIRLGLENTELVNDLEAEKRSALDLNEKLRLEIDKRHGMHQDLEVNQERYTLATSETGIIVWDWDAHTDELFIDEALVQEISHHEPTQARGAEFFLSIAHPEDRETLRREWREVATGRKRRLEVEYRIMDRDGTARWLQTHGLGTVDSQGRVTRIVGTSRDVSKRRKADALRERLEQALARIAAEWRSTFDAVESLIIITDRDGLVKRLNRAAKNRLGMEYDKVIDQKLLSIASGEPWEAASRQIEMVAYGRESVYDSVTDTATEEVWDVMSTISVASGVDDRIVVVITDSTQTVRLERALRRSEAMSAMGSLLGGVAHEVRNPLFGISAAIDAFESRHPEIASSDHIRMIRLGLSRLNALMESLLDYGRPRSRELTTVPISDLLAETATHCAPVAASRNISLKVSSDVKALVRCDRDRALQVFINLVENAIQHSPADSKVTVRAQQNGSQSVRCQVDDSGIGIEEKDLSSVFDPFFTRRKGGSGLGLSIVRRVADEHGWEVRCSNRPDGGARFTVTIPMVTGEGAGEGESEDSPDVGHSALKRTASR